MDAPETAAADQPKWQILQRNDRRVVGVLVEKAKTTPDNYPLTLNSLLNGCNQKSNRYPQMQLDEEHVFDALERLRKLGAVAEVQGDGRSPKFRHLLYDWLGVDKYELSVMAELLLRGAQTLGELRARAARMEPIAGMTELRPIIDSLYSKGLILYLTPPGRGCIVTHALYQEQELAKVKAEHGNTEVNVPLPTSAPVSASTGSTATGSASTGSASTGSATTGSATTGSATTGSSAASDSNEIELLRAEIAALRKELKEMIWKLRSDLDDVQSTLGVERD